MGAIRRTAGVWGPVTFAAASIAAATLQDDYSHTTHHVSGLAARGTASAAVMVPGFATLGVAGLVMEVPDDRLRWMVRTAGVTTLVAGAIPCSCPTCPDPLASPDATASDLGHAAASIATFLIWAALPIVAAGHAGQRWYRIASGALGVASLAGLVVAGWATRSDDQRKGLAQRAFLAPVFTWYALTSLHRSSSARP